ncbi:MAG: UDP-N-acetylmuramate--L-alanine ligase [Rickettsiales bacterium]|nr:UDP-N-acetylmuramate--L-alanine ligase [Rickettsiales bacterium]
MTQQQHNVHTIPLDIGVIHFVGIGGIGMSGIAEILHNLGYQVSGSDQSENPNVLRLREKGISIAIGHVAENVEGKAVVVKSTAVPLTNPEIIAARKQKIPVVKRSEMLAELARLKATVAVAGTHGKTTTTSMIGTLLEQAGLDPTVINGGIINAHGTNAFLGQGEWMVVEADESDGTFIRLPATIGVITNIDPEHLDYWKEFSQLRAAFKQFIEQLPFYGFAVACVDHPEVQRLIANIQDRRILTYGIEQEADVQAKNLQKEAGGTRFDVVLSPRIAGGAGRMLRGLYLSVPGQHNVLNVLSAVVIALEMKLGDDVIRQALEKFSGVKRRFTLTGEVNGIAVIDDYGHHPAEIAATLATARDVQASRGGRVFAVMQPHRYSRLERLFEPFCNCFGAADQVLITPVYAAGEKPVEGLSHETLVEGLQQQGIPASAINDFNDLLAVVHKQAQPNDMVVCLGAGSITLWAHSLPQALEDLRQSTAVA